MFIGFDIGGTNVKYGLVNSKGEILEKSLFPTQHNRYALLEDITRIIKKFQIRFDIKGIGVSAPGIIQDNGFMVTGGAIKEIYGINLKEEIENLTGIYTFIENDANAAAIAERWIGNAIGIDNYLCIVLGTGVGGGIVINGDIYRGKHGMAGEFGYMMIHDINSVEDVEESSLNRTAAVVGGLYHQYSIELAKNHFPREPVKDATEIMERAKNGEIEAQTAMKRFYQDISIGVVSLIAAYDPELVLIGGGISANSVFIENLKKEISDLVDRHQSMKFLKEKTIAQVLPTKLKNDAGLIGAVYQVQQKLNSMLVIK